MTDLYGQSIEDFSKDKVETESGGALLGFHASYLMPFEDWSGGFGGGLDIHGEKDGKSTFYVSFSANSMTYEEKRLDIKGTSNIASFRLGGTLDDAIIPFVMLSKAYSKISINSESVTTESSLKLGVGLKALIPIKNNSRFTIGVEYNGATETIALTTGFTFPS